MARKRKGLEHLDYQSSAYWQKLLTIEGLSMEKGRSDRLSYVGGAGMVESIEGVQYTDDGRIKPKPKVD
jgi:hypothetical protein